LSDFRERFIEPIDNASKPATIAALNFAAVVLLPSTGTFDIILRVLLGVGGLLFLLSAFAIFFFTIYPSRRGLWLTGSFSFLLGLVLSMTGLLLTVAALAFPS
jgi:hypothetical protein